MSTNEMPVTGERVVEAEYKKTEAGYAIYLMHQASYVLAEKWIQGKAVLDYGCGSGYGAAKLAERAFSVCAVDVSEEAISYARKHYAKPNLSFERIQPELDLPYSSNQFDVVTSFQVIEHVSDDAHYIREVYRILKPGGVFLIITPDRTHRLFPLQAPWNRWHIREYSPKSLSRLIDPVFSESKRLAMGAKGRISEIELERYKALKWITLPVTLPIFPFSVRAMLLGLLASVQSLARNKDEGDPGFDAEASVMKVEDVYFSESVEDSLNIVFICRK